MHTTKANSIGSLNYEYVRYTLVKDLQGNVIGLADKNGNLAAKYTYDAWGNILSVTDGQGNDVSGNPGHIANVNPLRYRGYYFDQETGFYYLHTRYYDPKVGRFINADEQLNIKDGLLGANQFTYCLNNPVNMSDPYGQMAVAIAKFALVNLWNPAGWVAAIISIFCAIVLVDSIEDLTINDMQGFIVGAGINNFSAIADISIAENIKFKYKEHTSNKQPSKRNKHEEGQTRHQRDSNKTERGDARRKGNPNKRRPQTNNAIVSNYTIKNGYYIFGSYAYYPKQPDGSGGYSFYIGTGY